MSDKFTSGFVSIIGRPNVGKSTFLNQVLQTKLSIATSKPQTTRDRILGVLDENGSQIIFLDTPGIHESEKMLNRCMLDKAFATLSDADLIIVMADPLDKPEKLKLIAENVNKSRRRAVLVLNKADRLDADAVQTRIDDLAGVCRFEACFAVSALNGEGLDDLMEWLRDNLPEGPRYFPEDMLTDLSMRFLAQELIREKVFLKTRNELPYSVAVEVEKFREGKTTSISAVIHVEKESQKQIVIGRGGAMLKEIGREARLDIQRMIGGKVYLELFVRVTKNWTKNPRILKELGYK